MTLDPMQIMLLALLASDHLFLWVLVIVLVRGQRAQTFPPVTPPIALPAPVGPTPPVVEPPAPPVVVPPVTPPAPAPVPPAPPVPAPVAGPVHKWVGKCSWFGGPNDTGSGDPTEGLALIGSADISKYQDVLLPGAHGDALFRQLNPDAHYIACRWDYSETPRSYLQSLHIPVRNPATGKVVADVRAVDWGPNAKTGRVADLSPGLMAALGVTTDGIVEVDIPLPAGGPAPPAPPAPATVTGLQPNTWPTQAECPSFYGDAATVKASLVNVQCPWLMNGKTHTIQVHSKCAASLERVLNYIWEYCGKSQDKIHSFEYDIFDGSYVPRNIAGTSTPSVHSYAAALDFDAARNQQLDPLSKTTFKENSLIVYAFKAESWVWGGDWTPASIDAMHFQAARVR